MRHIMVRRTSLVLLILALIACTSADNIAPVNNRSPTMMPGVNQGISPTQRRAIMSGEKPDWSEVYPQRINYQDSRRMKD